MRINNKTTYIAPDQLKMALLDFTNMCMLDYGTLSDVNIQTNISAEEQVARVDISALAETSMCPACWEQTFKSVLIYLSLLMTVWETTPGCPCLITHVCLTHSIRFLKHFPTTSPQPPGKTHM